MTLTTDPTRTVPPAPAARRADRATMPAVALAAGDQTALVAALSDLIRATWRRRPR